MECTFLMEVLSYFTFVEKTILKKISFHLSFYSCLFGKAKSRLKDIFSYYQKEREKNYSFVIGFFSDS